jgi:hypothetical protein
MAALKKYRFRILFLASLVLLSCDPEKYTTSQYAEAEGLDFVRIYGDISDRYLPIYVPNASITFGYLSTVSNDLGEWEIQYPLSQAEQFNQAVPLSIKIPGRRTIYKVVDIDIEGDNRFRTRVETNAPYFEEYAIFKNAGTSDRFTIQLLIRTIEDTRFMDNVIVILYTGSNLHEYDLLPQRLERHYGYYQHIATIPDITSANSTIDIRFIAQNHHGRTGFPYADTLDIRYNILKQRTPIF